MGYKTLLLEVFLRCLCRHTPSACHHRIFFNPQLLSNLRTKACLSRLCQQTRYFHFLEQPATCGPTPCGVGVVAMLSHRRVFCGRERRPQCPHSQHSPEAGLRRLRLRDEARAGSARLRTRVGAAVTGHRLLRAWLASSSPGRSWVCPPALTPVLGMGAPEQMGSLQARLGPERRRDQNTTEAGRAASACGFFPGPTQDPHGPLQNQL